MVQVAYREELGMTIICLANYAWEMAQEGAQG